MAEAVVAPDLAERILKAAQLAQPIFAAHDWKWGDRYRHPYDVPTVEKIADTLKRLYDNACASGSGSSSTGRLTVYVDADDGSIAADVQLTDLRDPVEGWYVMDDEEQEEQVYGSQI